MTNQCVKTFIFLSATLNYLDNFSRSHWMISRLRRQQFFLTKKKFRLSRNRMAHSSKYSRWLLNI